MGQFIFNRGGKMSGTFNLSHDQFDTMATDTLRGLVTDEDFTDVTLACQGDNYIKAHKVILSSYSSIFKNLFLDIKQQNPVIYLKGVQYEELKSIINFVYLGETKVKQDNFAGFMEIAREFEIKGLALNTKEHNKVENISMDGTNEDTVKSIELGEIDNTCLDDLKSGRLLLQEYVVKSEKDVKDTNQSVNRSLSEVDNVQQETDSSEKKTEEKPRKEFSCTECGKTCSEKSNLTKHVRSMHEGIVYPCTHCDHKAKQTGHLKSHMKAKHGEELVNLSKNQTINVSDSKADTYTQETTSSGMEIEEKSRKEFSCPECDKICSVKSNLTKHIKSQHERIVYPCTYCDHKYKEKANLKLHTKAKHGEVSVKN